MKDHKNKIYQTLNELAEKGGTVIFGGTSDKDIPLCELKQAFALNNDIYNRSFSDLLVTNALKYYDTYIADLKPESILIHIGESDIDFFLSAPSEFDKKYVELVRHIRNKVRECRIIIVSLKNYDKDIDIAEMNKHLRYIADSEQCEYADISQKRVWNPTQTKNIASFIYRTGFVRPLNIKRPIYDLAKILFCFEICSI